MVPDKGQKAANIKSKKSIGQAGQVRSGGRYTKARGGPSAGSGRPQPGQGGPAGQAFLRSRSSASRRIAAPSVSVRRSFTYARCVL